MSATLPGDIPGLLRRGSPVLIAGRVLGVVNAVSADGEVSISHTAPRDESERLVELDLSDPTGRAHAQWWVLDRYQWLPFGATMQAVGAMDAIAVINAIHDPARDSSWWTPARLSILAEVVLRLAGRWP